MPIEHWLVALGARQGDAALDWAARRAGGRAALEVIASGLEIPDPRAEVLHAAACLNASCPRVPRALHVVPRSLADEFAQRDGVDLVVLGLPSGRLTAIETNRVLGLIRVCRSPVVLVPGAGSGAAEPREIVWPATGRRPPVALRDAVRDGRDALRVVRTSGAEARPPAR